MTKSTWQTIWLSHRQKDQEKIYIYGKRSLMLSHAIKQKSGLPFSSQTYRQKIKIKEEVPKLPYASQGGWHLIA